MQVRIFVLHLFMPLCRARTFGAMALITHQFAPLDSTMKYALNHNTRVNTAKMLTNTTVPMGVSGLFLIRSILLQDGV